MKRKSLPYKLGRLGTYACITATAVLIFLRINGAIAWAWWVIFLPCWGPLALFLLTIEALFIVYYIAIKKLL